MAVFFTVLERVCKLMAHLEIIFQARARLKVNKACSNCRNDIKWNQDMIKECYHGH